MKNELKQIEPDMYMYRGQYILIDGAKVFAQYERVNLQSIDRAKRAIDNYIRVRAEKE